MSVTAWVMLSAFVMVLGSGALTLANLKRYRRVFTTGTGFGDGAATGDPLVSVCIPARNEEANIEEAVRSLLAQDWPNLEVLVYDDQSTDATPTIVARLCAEDQRVRRAETLPLPPGWNGKQHACWRMAAQARGRWMLFTDADVRFDPGCVSLAVREAQARDVGLLSTFPRQIVGSPGEALMVPMIFFLLFSYLPMGRMRRTSDPSTSAGCGQFLLVRQDAYVASGGHAGFKGSMHDGIKLPRAIRRAGFRTDLFDGTDLCRVRMYRGWAASWRGFAKNAYEGLGSVGLLVFLTVIHAVAHVLPWVVLAMVASLVVSRPVGPWPMGLWDPIACVLAAGAVLVAVGQRVVLARGFRHPLWIALAHPLGVLVMTAVQWHSFVLQVTGRRAWRGRVQSRAPLVQS